MKFKIIQSNDIVKITIEGNLESLTIKPFTEKIPNIIQFEKNVEIDFSAVEYVDSSGIRILLSLSKKLKDINKTVKIINCSESIKRILQLSSLQDIFM